MNQNRKPALWIDLVVAVLTFAPVVAAMVVYPDLPAQVPLHWNASGAVDRWTGKSYLSVLFPVVIAVLLQIVLLLMVYDVAADISRVTGKDQESDARRTLLIATNGLLQPLRVGVGALFAMVTLNIAAMAMQPAVISQRTFVVCIVVCVVGMLTFVAVRAMPVLTAQSRWEAVAPRSMPFFAAQNWRFYRSFYSNPKDPAFVVPRMEGAGVTFNFAHGRAKVYLALFAMLLALPIVAILAAL